MSSELFSGDKFGVVVILMGDLGPEASINISQLDEIAANYLAIKGFTAFMTGFETELFGPGKIRGILQVPGTESFAVAIDINLRGSGFETDERLQVNRNGVFCLIVPSDQLIFVRKFYVQTELFLVDKLKAVTTVNHLNREFFANLLKEYLGYLEELLQKEREGVSPETICYSLFEVNVLLSLPKEENLTARVIMQHSSKKSKGITLEGIRKITKRKRKEEEKIVNRLLEKGLIVAIPSETNKEDICYLAQ